MRRFAILSVLLVLPFAAAGEIDARYNESYDVEPGARLELFHGDGDVTITPWNEDRIQIDVTLRMRFSRFGLGRDPDFEMEFDQSGDTVRVREIWTRAKVIGGFSIKEREYTYEIQAPAWMTLELRGDDGDVVIQDWNAAIGIKSDDGDVMLTGVESDARLTMEDGDLRVVGFAGELELTSDDGDVSLEGCEQFVFVGRLEDGDLETRDCNGRFDVRTDDGDIEVDGRLDDSRFETQDGEIDLMLAAGSRGPIDVASDDGDVTIEVDPSLGFEFDLRSGDGSVRFNHSAGSMESVRDGEARGTVLGGGVQIDVRTNEGSIQLRER